MLQILCLSGHLYIYKSVNRNLLHFVEMQNKNKYIFYLVCIIHPGPFIRGNATSGSNVRCS